MADRSVRVGRSRHVRHTKLRGLLRFGPEAELASRVRRHILHRWLRQRDTDLDATATTNVITVVNATDIWTLDSIHNLALGFVDGPYRLTTATTLPAGSFADTPYWFRAGAGATGQLFHTREDAELDQNPLDVSDNGTGVHTIRASTQPVSLMELLRAKLNTVKPVRLHAETDIDNLVDDLT